MYKICLAIVVFLFSLALNVQASDFILDPGHSPKHPGTDSCSGGLEYKYNEELAEVIVNYLAVKNIEVDLTKKKGMEISLQDRAKKSVGKKLFLSLHHDSAQQQYIKTINGHSCSNYAKGFSIFVSAKNPHFEESKKYARELGQNLVDLGLKPSKHHGEKIKGENRTVLDPELGIYQFDDLIVLKQSKSPAILLEAAVIINPEDDKLAKNRDFQENIAEAVYVMFSKVNSFTK